MDESCKRELRRGYDLNINGVLAKGPPMPLSIFESLRKRVKYIMSCIKAYLSMWSGLSFSSRAFVVISLFISINGVHL